MEEPSRLQSMGSLRVGHDWTTSLSLFTFMHWEGNGTPLQCSCLENPREGGAWWADIYGVAQSWTRLKRLGSSSNKTSKPSFLSFFFYLFECFYFHQFSIINSFCANYDVFYYDTFHLQSKFRNNWVIRASPD